MWFSDPILTVKLNGKNVCKIYRSQLPVEKSKSVKFSKQSSIEFEDAKGFKQSHDLGEFSGWMHLSVRVHDSLALQSDCVISEAAKNNPKEFRSGKNLGIRFQPFLIGASAELNNQFLGQGLFKRGLHFKGEVTPGNVILSCICDACSKSFFIQSYHMGFSEMGYFYSDSGKDTLLISTDIPGVPPALGEPDPEALKVLESRLPLAPDKTHFKYLNPFRCPHCNSEYIDFQRFPEIRSKEYYANGLWDHEPITISDVKDLA